MPILTKIRSMLLPLLGLKRGVGPLGDSLPGSLLLCKSIAKARSHQLLNQLQI